MKKSKLSIILLILLSSPLYGKENNQDKSQEKETSNDVIIVKATSIKNKETFSSLLLNNREEIKGKQLEQIKTNTIGIPFQKLLVYKRKVLAQMRQGLLFEVSLAIESGF
ncbi:hypothetical protein [Escherichia coli]|uniref:hypothetical protein n=1 Tax=Escherichia coli TaxID=562 RepID=UPI001FCE4847|nr:hypothetical protein [Escherichia coli]